MKERLTNNIGLKILSGILAIVVWLMVVNISDPETSGTKSVPVEIRNEDVLTMAGKTYNIVGNATTVVSYDVRTRNSGQIRATDFNAYVDLNDMFELTGSVPIHVDVVNHKDLLIGTPTAKPSVLRIEVEDIVNKSFSIEVRTSGMIREGYTIGGIDLDADQVSVSGPASILNRIDHCAIVIDIEDASKDLDGYADIQFFNAQDSEVKIMDERVITNRNSVNYHASILNGKTVPVNLQFSGAPAQGYKYTGYFSSASSVTLRGSSQALAGIDEINVPGSILNLNGSYTNREVQINLYDYIPNGISIVGDGNLTVTMLVESLNEKTFYLSMNDMRIVGQSYGLMYSLTPSVVSVTVTGLQSDLDSLNMNSFGCTIDFTGMTEGVYPGRLEFSLPAGYKLERYSAFNVSVEGTSIGPSETPGGSSTVETIGPGDMSFEEWTEQMEKNEYDPEHDPEYDAEPETKESPEVDESEEETDPEETAPEETKNRGN